MATWRLETGNGTSNLWLNSFNAGGIKCGDSYCQYDNEEHGMSILKDILIDYVNVYGYDLKSIRQRYCGIHCGDSDLITFTEIFNEELTKQKTKQKTP